MAPLATYRLQFHAAFTFKEAEPLIPYLAGLGISHLYASPIATARKGSNHGYDVVDPTRINPELGSEADFRDLVAAARAQGLGLILDIVPNHMAVGGGDNVWWLDVLEKGEASAHAAMFDIDWRPLSPALRGKVAAPFLGRPYAEALKGGDVQVRYDAAADRLAVVLYDAHVFPIRREDYAEVLGDDPGGIDRRFDASAPEGEERLHALLERQNFRLAYWKTAGDEINWRRFFDVTELAGVRIERPEVFERVHRLPLRLYAEGLIDGVRVDHVDGLADPAGYCRLLRQSLAAVEERRPRSAPGGPAYVVVEKILAAGERLSPDWSVDGTTGYDYMNMASAVLHDPAGGPALGAYWTAVSGRSAEFAVEERAARPEILLRSFSAQLDAAVAAFHALAVSDRSTRDVTAGALRRGLIALLTVFPCYRTYGFGAVPDPDDQTRLDGAVGAAAPLAAAGEDGVLAQIRQWILGGGPGDPALAAEAARRFQQLSAPVTAKAVEDTAFYRFTRLLSRNDVGFTPGEMAVSVARFHHEAATRGRHFPAAMLATASHDHKRGEDVRARLAVLSERAEDWTARAAAWSELNRALSMTIHPADAYALYQTLVGSMPLDLQLGDRVGLGAWAERVGAWQKKALREAKLRSSWAKANDDYEHVCDAFLRAILDPDRSSAFLADLFAFVDDIAPAGAMNGLVQAALKCVVPGVPDIYQGAEFWDFSLVDPDNRRPVDFGVRARALEEGLDVATLMERWRDGRIKQALIRDLLHLRRRHHRLFRAGGHRPVAATGERADHVIAFMREDRNGAVLFVAALRCAADVRGRTRPAPGADWWGHTALTVPALTPPGDQAAFMGARAAGAAADPLLVRDLLADRPFAWRVMRPSDA